MTIDDATTPTDWSSRVAVADEHAAWVSSHLTPRTLQEEIAVAVRATDDAQTTLLELCECVYTTLTNETDFESGKAKLEHVLGAACDYFLQCDDVRALMYSIVRDRFVALTDSALPTSSTSFEVNAAIDLMLAIGAPDEERRSFLLRSSAAQTKAHRRALSHAKLRESFSRMWLALTRVPMDARVLGRVLTVVGDVLGLLTRPDMLYDMYVRAFALPEPLNLQALHGMFLLIHNHNLEYPNFYPTVYKMVQPHVAYSPHREEFFKLLNLFLSSTHVPAYMVCAFVKRILRVAILAPVEMQAPLQRLVRSLCIRFHCLEPMVHRAGDALTDPFDVFEDDPQLCGASTSSLWELKALQSHYHPAAAVNARFVEAPLTGETESHVRWKHITNEAFSTSEWSRGITLEYEVDGEGDRPQKRPRRLDADENDEVYVPVAFLMPKTLF